jgi:xanthine dehydrogenase iron-sulfur cluster and FAD-binding subunit A
VWKTYFSPHSLDEALQLLAQHKESARLVAGGTDLLVEIERSISDPEAIIDISRIPDLDQITQDAEGYIHLGPLVTHNQVAASKLCRERAFPLVKACWQIGAPQIRNRGTVAGNLATASPANDTITPLWALGANLTLASARGSRSLSFENFFTGARQTALEPDEIIVDISFPGMHSSQVGTFTKQSLRRAQAISVVNTAVVLTMQEGRVAEACIALGSIAPTIIHAASAEDYLAGQALTPEVIVRAGDLAAQAGSPLSDIRGSADYRRYVTGLLVRNSLDELAKGCAQEAVPARPVMLWGRSDGYFSASNNGQTLKHTRADNEAIETTINGQQKTIHNSNHQTLLGLLREEVGLTGTKEGCAEGECGACTVLLDGIAVMACLVPAPQAHGRQIVTVEGLSQNGDLHPVQQAFVDMGAVQCGFCIPGFVMSGVSLIEERQHPTRDEIKQAFTGNFCRCTGYYPIIKAIETVTASEGGAE